MYDDDLSKKMTVNAVQKVLSSTPDKLYDERIGLRDIKAVGLRENYADLIDVQYHKEMCPMPPLEVWIKVKNWYLIGTKIERQFPKDNGVFYDATVTDIDIRLNQVQSWKTSGQFNFSDFLFFRAFISR